MAINTYLSIITLNVKGFNAPIKGHRVLNEEKNNIPIFAVYKRPTSEYKIHTD